MTTVGGGKFHRPWSAGAKLKSLNFDGRSLKREGMARNRDRFCIVLYSGFAPREDNNDTDCFCDGGRNFGYRSRFRDFASRADRAAFSGRHRRHSRRHPGILPSSVLPPSVLLSSSASLSPTLASLLVASRLSALLVRPADKIVRRKITKPASLPVSRVSGVLRRTHVESIEARLLFVAKRTIEFHQRGLHRV